MELSEIREQAARAAEEVCAAAKLRVGDLFVVGCSSSEVCGEKIGTHSSVEVAEAGISGIWLNWTHKERPESEVGCFEAHDFLEAADHIRTLF